MPSLTKWLTIRSRPSPTRSAAASSSASPPGRRRSGTSRPGLRRHQARDLQAPEGARGGRLSSPARSTGAPTRSPISSPRRPARRLNGVDRQRALWGRLLDVVDEYRECDFNPDEHPSDRHSRGLNAARDELLVEEKKPAPGPRRARREAPPGCRGWPSRRTTPSKGRTARRRCSTPSRTPPAHRLPLLLRAGRHHYAAGRLHPERAALAARSSPTRSPTPLTASRATRRSRSSRALLRPRSRA